MVRTDAFCWQQLEMIEAVEKEHMLEGQHIVKKTHKGEIDMDEDLSTLEVLCNLLLENGRHVIFIVKKAGWWCPFCDSINLLEKKSSV